ncbi:hypothetical protein AVEN_23744-1 [Araneus ventricosus]|uniref:Uncharacterized protein n=1 Tax=Araneus ventricosus TaxID=182803 RepID=A0A4Y2LJU3_ARAVE|nr:hypothetical protein AVEN_23744-1 [Araneus ventricosus]
MWTLEEEAFPSPSESCQLDGTSQCFLQLFAFGTPEKLEEFMNRKVSYRHPPTMEYRNLTLSIIGHFRVRDRPSLPGHKSTLGLSNKIEDFLQSSPEFLSISRILKMGTSKIAIASNSL